MPPDVVIAEVTAAGLTRLSTNTAWSAGSQPASRKGGTPRPWGMEETRMSAESTTARGSSTASAARPMARARSAKAWAVSARRL